jgi:O-antigen/teichoic acid export membrane protein
MSRVGAATVRIASADGIPLVTGWFARTASPRATLVWLRGNRLLRNNAIFLAGALGAGAFGYVFHFATGRLLGPAQYAVVASAVAALYFINLPSVVVQLVSARFTSLASSQDRLGNLPGLLVRVSILSLAVGLPIAAVLVVFNRPLSAYLQVSDRRVLYVLAIASLISLLVSATRGALQGLRRFVALSVNTVLDMTLRVVSSIVLMLAGLGAVGAVFALVIGPFVAYVQSLLLFRGLGTAAAGEQAPFGALSRYAVLTSVAAIGTTYLYNADVLMSKHFLTAQAAGIYAAASVLGRVVYFLGLTVTQVMFPEVATLHGKDRPHFHVVDQSIALVVLVAVSLVTVYWLVPGLVVLPYGGAFDPVKPHLWRFALALGLLALANLLINYFLSLGSSRFAIPLIATCFLETALIFVFHSGPAQILTMVLVSTAVLGGVLVVMYGEQRFRPIKSLS